MSRTKLVVSQAGETREVLLEPKGVTLGRGVTCDVVLDHETVSRVHARIYEDPFGRWIVEDLGSQNGVVVDGKRVKAHRILAGQKIGISHFSLIISPEHDQPVVAGSSGETTIPIVDKGLQEDIVSHKAGRDRALSSALMQDLNELTGRLLKLPSPSQLYSEACSCLAQMLNTLVAIVRLPCNSDSLAAVPDMLACHFGAGLMSPQVLRASNLHLSKRVLDAVRSSDTPVMARSTPSRERDLVLTVVDESSPHLVFGARVNDLGDAVDALYVDILESTSPQEMFDFIEAVARQINFAQKNLFFSELQKQEKAAREANMQLREKDRIKDEYVARVTHDIKGHLAAITSCLAVAADGADASLGDRQVDFMNRAARRTAQLSDFVKELLNLTQMRLSGQVRMQPFALTDCLSRALESVARKADDKSITVTADIDPSLGEVSGDEFSINEMVANLLFNAIKYTPENKSVHLEAKSYDDDHVRIEISDTGIGIPADEVESVFDEFFRARNAKKSEKDGTGLGLSIVKQIVERHGGRITVRSRENEGTKFTVVLPKKL
ncbi:MAG TPA: ATP-binding protein [Sedimentisphaerales bacterium]|nr:ATP-binding protein [Sedimentisphaerales bacterium]